MTTIIQSQVLFAPDQLIEYLGISRTTYYRLSKANNLPPFKQISPRVRRFLKADVDLWLKDNPVLG